jgi:hypothetical protein
MESSATVAKLSKPKFAIVPLRGPPDTWLGSPQLIRTLQRYRDAGFSPQSENDWGTQDQNPGATVHSETMAAPARNVECKRIAARLAVCKDVLH